MKWVKWPYLALMVLLAIISLIAKSESDSRLELLSGYYFQAIFAFSFLSNGILTLYYSLVLEHLAANYPDECRRISYWRYLKFALNTPARKVLAMTAGDEKLHLWTKRGIFWLYCSASFFFTMPIGAIVFLVLSESDALFA
jgi:bacteriorhodopsin